MNEASDCRHEFIIIFQRRWKQLERRLVGRRAYLPVGFKATDFNYLGDGGYSFCTSCRARLYPRLTRAQKAAARLAKAAEAAARAAALGEQAAVSGEAAESVLPVEVEELELESVGLDDIEAEGVKLSDEREDEEEEEMGGNDQG